MLFVRNFLFPNHLPILICPNPYRRNLTPWKAAFLISLEEEVKTAKKELEALKAVFDTAIKAVTDTEHHDILAKRYLEFKDWNQIAEEMGYSKPSCYRLHREALAGMKS